MLPGSPIYLYLEENSKASREARSMFFMDLKVYTDKRKHCERVFWNGGEILSMKKWDALGKRNLKRHVYKLKNALYDKWRQEKLDFDLAEEKERLRVEEDFNRDFVNDVMKFGVRERHSVNTPEVAME